MLERTVGRYLSWAGLFVVGILVCAAIWNWRLLSVALAFTGLLAVSLAAIADNAGDGNSDGKAVLDAAHRSSRKIARLRTLL